MDSRRQILLAKYDHQVPRYTSYPPATAFKPVEKYAYAQWLQKAQGDLSLYIHIPFCARLCYYCGCNMRVVNNYDPVESYLSVLKKEFSLIAAQVPASSKVSHIHFGGGSPTMVRASGFLGLIESLQATFSFSEDIEISIEADPRHLDEEKIAAYANAGVTRLSIGVQDFDDAVLQDINRPQPYQKTHEAVALSRDYGINNINFDLMYGLPGQSVETIQRTMDLAVILNPDRISYFGYAHVPWMKKHMNLLPQEKIPGFLSRYELQETGAAMLIRAGYIPVGIDHFVRAGDSMKTALDKKTLRRNFQGYTTDTAKTLIGIGSSSIGEFHEGYHQNNPDVREYSAAIESGAFAHAKEFMIPDQDRPVKKIIEQLMCFLSVDLQKIRHEFGLDNEFFDKSLKHLESLRQDGIVYIEKDIISINPDYRILARITCQAFDSYTIKDPAIKRHAAAV